ncbi:DUF6962 family protein [Emticicia sp. SJ17W-69]|uniref:DUF6962 family protein n=1 Tax=Emticicia sp. SJ17W-69 TaxID=3421657 RepID=UPI003EBD7CB3
MELSHVISDAVLTLVGAFVFFKYLLKLELATCLLWEAFILSVTAAAFFGVIRFLGYSQAIPISEFFQHLAGTVGAFCLVLVSIYLVLSKPVEKNIAYLIIAIGFVVFAFVQFTNNLKVLQYVSMIAIPLVLLIGIFGLIKGRSAVGSWMVLAVLSLVLATYNKSFMPNTILIQLMSIIIY